MKLCQRVEISTENYHVNFQSEIHIRFPSTGIRSWPYSWTKLCLKSNKLFDFLKFTVRCCLFYIQSWNLAIWCLRMWRIHKCHRKCNLMSISNHKLAYYNLTFYSYIKFGSVSWKTPNFFQKKQKYFMKLDILENQPQKFGFGFRKSFWLTCNLNFNKFSL